MAYQLLYHPSVTDADLPGIPVRDRSRLRQSLEQRVAVRPERFGKPLRHTLRGLRSCRVGDYRIIYAVRGREVWVLRIGHRREVYQHLEARTRLASEEKP